MTKIVVSYINPDLDGVACSVAIQMLESLFWQARVMGVVDAETRVVLRELDLAPPPQIVTWTSVESIWLVDTHHIKQLPPEFPANRVLRITDHHPAGDSEHFVKAEIQNEPVGAAATLVTEMFGKQSVDLSPVIAVLLQTAIVSNTLNFRAPSTSPRDRAAFEVLRKVQPVSDRLLHAMQEARRSGLAHPTDEIVCADTKVFETEFGSVVVAQVESPGSLALLARPDLMISLNRLAHRLDCAAGVLNLADTEAIKSALVVTDPRIRAVLTSHLDVIDESNTVITVDGLLQRKTHIVPVLTGMQL